jgi:hypothetical protein
MSWWSVLGMAAFGMAAVRCCADGEPASAAGRGMSYPRIANCYFVQLTPTSSEADIRAIARYGLLIGGVWANWADPASVAALRERMAALRKLNPHIVILDFSCSAPYAYPAETDVPADGWLLQTDGRFIDGWPGTRMVDLTKPSVVEFMAERAVRSVRDRGFDGAFIDCMAGGFDTWAANIASGEPYTVDTNRDGKADDLKEVDRLWTAAKTQIANRVRERLGPRALFMTNQAGDWGLPSMNGILLEDYLDYVLAGTLAWDSVMADYRKWTARCMKPTLTTIVSSSGIEPPFDAWSSMPASEQAAILDRGKSLTARMRFGLATTLMGDGYFAYDLHTRWRGQRWWYPEYDAKLGYPKGVAKRRPDGAWQRSFDGGLVVVNPGELDITVSIGRLLRDVSSGLNRKLHVVPGRDGRVFVPSAPGTRANNPPSEPAFSLGGTDRVVLRADRALIRLDGAAAIVDAQGRVSVVGEGADAWLSGMAAFIVGRPWFDYAYTGFARTSDPDGSLRYVGERTDGAARIRQEQTVRAEGRSLVIEYRWTALTDARFVMFRHQTDLPATAYGGGRARIGGATVSLPVVKGPVPELGKGADGLVVQTRKRPELSISHSSPANLVDERHYGVNAYRLGSHPAPSIVKAGDTWSLTVRVATGPLPVPSAAPTNR